MVSIIAFLALLYGVPTLIAVMVVRNNRQRLNTHFTWRVSRISAGIALYAILAIAFFLAGFVLGEVLFLGFFGIALMAQIELIPIAIALSVAIGFTAIVRILWNPLPKDLQYKDLARQPIMSQFWSGCARLRSEGS